MITITHTHEEGTLLDGSSKGDGVFDIVRQYGFRFFPSIKAIGIQSSRDKPAARWKIDAAAKALRAAGHEVTVEIDDTPRDRGTVLEDAAARLDDRKEALTAKAERLSAQSDAAWQRSNQLVEHIPPGQPILVGHHSERGHRRTLQRSWDLMGKSVQLGREAKETGHRAEAAGTSLAYSATPGVTARRILKDEAELRRLERSGSSSERTLAAVAFIGERLRYDREALQAAIAEGRYKVWSKDNVHVGDLVPYGAGWAPVVKVNKTTVSVATGYSWTNALPYVDMDHGVRCPHIATAAEQV